MKMIKVFLLMVMLLGFFVCENEDNFFISFDDIVGNWEVFVYSYEG